MACFRLALALAVGTCEVRSVSLCLDNAIPSSQRRNLSRANGESYPVGLWLNDWAAGYATSATLRLLIEERLGYNVLDQGPGPGTLNAFYALMGCTSPLNLTDRGCGAPVTYSHINMETWAEGYTNEWNEIQVKFTSTAPVNAGSMGYVGKTSLFFPQRILEQAYVSQGTALDYFRGWNISWSSPWQFFDSLGSFNRSLLYPCNQTRFMLRKPNEDYLSYTGDAEGVQQTAGGDLVAICPDGYFWLPPSCRADASRCVPYITGGLGWQLDEIMQKATAYHMPLALAVAGSFRAFAELPLQVTSTFYWWVPDPTFLELQPVEVQFPPYDFNAWARGDKRTGISDTRISKLVSQDLSSLAPRVEDLVRNVRFHLNDINTMMRDQKDTGDSFAEVACRWLRTNQRSWDEWLPDVTKCFPGFGLYDTNLESFVDARQDTTHIECRACVSGRYSSRLDDSKGLTYVCRECEPGTSQAFGAAQTCEPCQLGEYQNYSGSKSCNRCDIGFYQDTRGSPLCMECPAGGTTLGLGSVSLSDCGCKADFIDIGDGNGSLYCTTCGEGLECPPLSTLDSLATGTALLGREFLPQVLQGYYSAPEQPLGLFRCSDAFRCPGGAPGSCGGGLLYTACTDCADGRTLIEGECLDCQPWHQISWIACIFLFFIGLALSYYLLTSTTTAKASVLFTTTCAFGMTIAMLQSVGIIGMMTVDFPEPMRSIYAFLQIFTLDVDAMAISCVAGTNKPLCYLLTVLFFPAVLLWLLTCHFASQLLPHRHRWEITKTRSVMGAALQVAFSTMSNIALAPLMCFSHPNGVHSVLKYPSVTCGSEGHAVMMVAGMALLAFGVLGFLSLCAYLALMVPSWSSRGQHDYVRSARFLVFRFRLDSWWWGVPLLVRGPLLSLPLALATDFPPVQVMFVTLTMLLFLTGATRAWPWKVPLLNMLDCFMTLCIVMLVASMALQLESLDSSMQSFVAAFSTAILSLLGLAMLVLLLSTSFALLFRSALGGQNEIYIFNLQKVPSAISMSGKLKIIAAELAGMEVEDVCQAVESMSILDLNLLLASMSLLALEVVPQVREHFSYNRRSSLRLTSRIRTNSFAAKPKQTQAERMAKIDSMRSHSTSSAAFETEQSVPSDVKCLAVHLHEAASNGLVEKQDKGFCKKPGGSNEVQHADL